MTGNESLRTLNPTEQNVINAYGTKSYKCRTCEAYCQSKHLHLYGPISFFNIGSKFVSDPYKVVFVGKTHWFDERTMNDTRPIAFGFKDGLLREKDFTGSPFLRFIWRIAEQLYPEEEDDLDKLLDHIAITNVLKCNTVGKNYVDTTPFALVDNCIEVLEEEIRALQPKHIVMFTGRAYDEYIGKLTFGFEPVNITNQTCTKQITDRVEIKHKSVCWWLRDFSENGHAKLRLLRTRHPQGAPLELVNEVVNSVRN